MTTDREAPLTAGSPPVDDAHYRTAWPFEEATEDDRLAHMAGAHHFLTDGVDLHAKLHRLGPGVVPHEHLTSTEALLLRRQKACTGRDDRMHHPFLPVNGHPDDDECTHRDDGTDATYCGLPEAAHEDCIP